MTNAETAERLRTVLIEARYLVDKLCEQDRYGGIVVPEKPPTQAIGAHGIDSAKYGDGGGTGQQMTEDMKTITRQVYEPEVRQHLADRGGFELPEQVQHARRLCEQFILKACGATNFRALADGAPAQALAALTRELA
jgi:hypothetical protein